MYEIVNLELAREGMKEVMKKFGEFLESPDGKYVELLDCHYTVID